MSTTRIKQRGVNLVELLVTISIAALSLTLGVPAFDHVRVRADRSSAMIELIAAAKLARSEAALSGTPVSICATSDGLSCNGSTDWSNGWLVFRDADEDLKTPDPSDVLAVTRFERSQFTITADDKIGAGITFGLFGFAEPGAGEFTYTDQAASRKVQLTHVGRLNVIEIAPQS
jgi:type IV fimbrial biogenesis protein FimT